MTKDELILIVDDDPNLREIVRFALDKEGFRTVEAGDGRAALDAFHAAKPTALVLDITMPEMDGTEVCRQIRKTSDVPILFLSSRDDELDRILGLELGGDDYVTKPFSPRELVARVKAACRRAAAARAALAAPRVEAPPETLRHGSLTLDLATCRASLGPHEIVLTAMEFNLLRTLLARPSKVYTRDELMSRAYDDQTVVEGRTIDSHIRRIRRKFEACGVDPVETVTGFGYRLAQKL